MVRKTHKQGFTLIELLVVISIIALLTTVVLVSLNKARSKARDTQRLFDIKQIQNALDLYYLANNSYPSSGSCGGTVPNGSWCNSIQSFTNGYWIKNNGNATAMGPYIPSTPVDPKPSATATFSPSNGGGYFYFSPGPWYMIVFGLENYPHPLEATDGVRDPVSGQGYHYGNNTNGVITIGRSTRSY